MKILMPWAASASAVAAPIPRFAPVMRTTLSLSPVSIIILPLALTQGRGLPGGVGEPPRTFDHGLGAAFDELAVRENRPVNIPRLQPIEECDTPDAPVAQQQPE